MILHKKYAYARDALVERICPCCNYSDRGINSDTKFIILETMYCKNHPQGCSTRLYACPKCGTVGIDVYEIERCD